MDTQIDLCGLDRFMAQKVSYVYERHSRFKHVDRLAVALELEPENERLQKNIEIMKKKKNPWFSKGFKQQMTGIELVYQIFIKSPKNK